MAESMFLKQAQKTMRAPESSSFLSILDASPNPVPGHIPSVN